MGFFANTFWTVAFPCLAGVLGVIGLLLVASEDRARGKAISGLFCWVLTVVCIFGFVFSATHGVIGVNKRAVVVSWATGSIVNETRSPGLTSLPFATGRILIFNGGTSEQVCYDFTPSVLGGYEVRMKTCFLLNLRAVDWVAQYSKYATGYGDTVAIWGNQLAQYVAVAVKEYRPQDLTAKRDEVTDKIKTSTAPWLENEGIPVAGVALANWDFSNAQVAKAYDDTVIAQTRVMVAQADYNAAVTQRDVDTFRADTANMVLASRTTALLDAVKRLGITSDQAKVDYLTLQWLAGVSPSDLRSIILNMGTEQVQPAVPVTP